MDIKFLEEMIRDETDNAKEYAAEALELRSTHPKWANDLMRMSQETEKNVDCLYRILEEAREEEKKSPTANYGNFSDEDYKRLINDYADKRSTIRSMKEMYYRR